MELLNKLTIHRFSVLMLAMFANVTVENDQHSNKSNCEKF